MSEPTNMLQWALYYGSLGLAVIPVPQGKKGPIIKNWTTIATSDPEQITEWWTRRPDDNIGFVVGAKSEGVFDLDIEVGHGHDADGLLVLRKWESENAPLPDTWQYTSGGGGIHMLFRSDLVIDNDTDYKLHDDIEVRGNGLNVILPPSLHASGNRYTWDVAPEDIELAEADETVLRFVGMLDNRGKTVKKSKEPFQFPQGKIKPGCRNRILFQAGGYLQGAGFPDSAITAALEAINRDECDPPVADDELEGLIRNILGYQKGRRFSTWMESGRLLYRETLKNLRDQLTK